MESLLNISPESWPQYICYAAIGAVVVRIFNSLWRTFEIENKWENYFFIAGKIFIGTGCREYSFKQKVAADYLLGLIIGFFEVLAYPLLILTNNPLIIGAWLTFKTVHKVGYAPKYERGIYNRYLLANALVLVYSLYLARTLNYVC